MANNAGAAPATVSGEPLFIAKTTEGVTPWEGQNSSNDP
jgi:hypothetical protein